VELPNCSGNKLVQLPHLPKRIDLQHYKNNLIYDFTLEQWNQYNDDKNILFNQMTLVPNLHLVDVGIHINLFLAMTFVNDYNMG
jgi:hypothetical protein